MRKRGGIGKRGQITVFIIIAIVLLFSAALIFYIRGKVAEYRPPVETVEQVPLELHPVKSYVEACLYKVSVEGITLMGMQSGWVSTTDSSLSGQSFSNFIDPTESETLTFFSFNIPYWFYMKSSNRCAGMCQFDSRKPPLRSQNELGGNRAGTDTSMEAQLDRYVRFKMPECLAGFYSFEAQGITVKELQPMQPTTTVTDKDVVVALTYPLEIVIGSSSSRMSLFVQQIPVNLRQIYELGESITLAQNTVSFLERGVLDAIVRYSSLDNPDLPPMNAFTLGPGGIRYWSVFQVRKYLMDHMIPFVNAFQIKDTLNYQPSIVQYSDSEVIRNMQRGSAGFFDLVMLERPAPLEASFYYLGFPIYLDISPKQGGLLGPEQFGGMLGGFINMLSNLYELSYDISFPVVVKLHDPAAFKGDGYSFQFAIEANIRNNKPFTSDSKIFVLQGGQDNTFFNTPYHRLSGNITIRTLNKKDNSPMPGVSVQYSCGPLSSNIGVTELDDSGNSILVSRFPVCVGGILSLSKEDVLTKNIPLDIMAGETKTIVVS